MEDFKFEPQPSAGKIAFLRMALAKFAPVKPQLLAVGTEPWGTGARSCLQFMLAGGC